MENFLSCSKNKHIDTFIYICFDKNCKDQGKICKNCMEENHIGHTFLSIDKFKQKLRELIQNSQNSENNKSNEKGFNIDKLQKKLKNIEEESRINGLFFQKEFFALQNKIQNINSQIEKKKNTKNLVNLFFSKETDNFEDSNNLKEIINLIELDYDEGAAHFRKKSFSEQEIKDFNKDFQNYNDYYEILQSKLKSITVEIKNLLNFQLFLDNKPKFLENIQDFDENDDNVESSEDESIMSQSGKQKRVKLRNSWWEYIGICLKEKYLEKNEVFCSFCGESNKNLSLYQILGVFYGPYSKYNKHKKVSNENYYVHELCALWTSGITLNKEGSIKGSIDKEVKRSKLQKCQICKLSGAGVGCNNKSCKISYHYKCISDNENIKLDKNDYLVFCPEHSQIKKKKIKEIISNNNSNKDNSTIEKDSSLEKSLHSNCLDKSVITMNNETIKNNLNKEDLFQTSQAVVSKKYNDNIENNKILKTTPNADDKTNIKKYNIFSHDLNIMEKTKEKSKILSNHNFTNLTTKPMSQPDIKYFFKNKEDSIKETKNFNNDYKEMWVNGKRNFDIEDIENIQDHLEKKIKLEF